MGREPRAVWEKRIERWRDSGLTAKEFAVEIGVEVGRRRYWEWHLTKTGHGAVRRSAGGAGTATREPWRAEMAAIPFVEVAAPAPSEEPIELVAASGLRVRVPARFDEEALRRILRAVG